MMLLALPARAQQTAETDTASQPTAQAPVPLADVLTESESVSASIAIFALNSQRIGAQR